MFLLKAFEDRIVVPVSAPSLTRALITDADVPGVFTAAAVIPNVQSFELTAHVAPPFGFGVQFADQTTHEVTISATFPSPIDLGLAFAASRPFGFFGTPATLDGFTFF